MAGGDYGRVRLTFWTDPDIKRKLTAEQKALLLYYFTSPHGNMVGLYHCPPEYAASEVGISVQQVQEWTAGALSPFLTYDDETEEVFVHNAARHQIGDELKVGDKRIPAVLKTLREVHSKGLVSQFLALYGAWPLGQDSQEAPHEPLESPIEANAVAVTPAVTPATTTLPNGSDGHTPGAALVLLGSNGNGTKRVQPLPARRDLTFSGVRDQIAQIHAELVEGTRKRLSAEQSRTVAAEIVFAYWAAKTDSQRSLMDPKREALIVARLKESGGDISEMLYTVDGALKDEWHNPAEGRKKLGIEMIFRNRAKIEELAGSVSGYRQEKPHPMSEKYAEIFTPEEAA